MAECAIPGLHDVQLNGLALDAHSFNAERSLHSNRTAVIVHGAGKGGAINQGEQARTANWQRLPWQHLRLVGGTARLRLGVSSPSCSQAGASVRTHFGREWAVLMFQVWVAEHA